ncbi:MAG: Permease of the drug/metabolite transporter superfamily [Mucilaginibacter sp.]|nr:Permease of the drug/metabolite transporter superfamily [Mucilaginibacter sp.]
MMNIVSIKKFYEQTGLRHGLIMLSILVLWSSSYIGIRYALTSYTPENLGFLRYLMASVVFLIIATFQKIKLPEIKDLPGLTAIGLFGFTLYNLLLNYGETTVDAGTSSFIINTVPFFSLLFAVLKKQERAKKSDWLGLVIAFSGVALIVFSKNKGLNTFNWYTVLILGAAICQALSFSIQKQYLIKYTPVELTSYTIWIGTILMAFFTKQPFSTIVSSPLFQTLTIVYLGVFPGAIAFLLMGIALKKYQLSKISSYLFLIPL